MAPIDYFPQRSALYEVDETSPFLTNYADFFSSYDDIARKYQSERDKAQQEYKDLLSEASRPRPVGGGELLTQALLSFGAPLLGKAIGGNAVGAAGSDLAQKAISDLDVKLDADYKTTQQALALQAQEAKQQMGAFDKAILELPFKKLDRQGQIVANRDQMEATYQKQAALQEDSQAHALEMEGIRSRNRMAELQYKNPPPPQSVEDAFIATRKAAYERDLKRPYTPEQEQVDRYLVRDQGARGVQEIRLGENAQMNRQLHSTLGKGVETKPGVILQTKVVDEGQKFYGKVENVIASLRDFKSALQSRDLSAIRTRYYTMIQDANQVDGFGQQVTNNELNVLANRFGPQLETATTFEDLQRVITASGINPLQAIDDAINKYRRQANNTLDAQGFVAPYGMEDEMAAIRADIARMNAEMGQ